MFKYIKDSFNLTNKYIILATPLILFSLLLSVYVLVISSSNMIFALMFAFILVVLMIAAFLSGWFGMVKDCVSKDDFEEPNMLIKNFSSGVGEYFLSVLGMIFNVFVLSALIVLAAYFTGMKFIGDIGITPEALSKSMESVTTMKEFLLSLSDTQLLKLNLWNLLLFASMSVTYFLFMFYPPALFFKTKNPFKALVASFKDLFCRRFFLNLALYLMIFITYFVLSIFTTIFGMNVVMHFVFTLINFYYLVFIAVLVFNYYYINFAKIGGNLDEKV